MKTTIKRSIVLLFALLLATPAIGASAGSVLLLKGQQKIQKADDYQVIDKPNARVLINENDQIHTAENTRAKVTMRGQKETVHLYANSFLTLNSVDEEKSEVSILIGKARFVVEPTTSKLSSLRRKFQIRTGNTFIGIRGTDLIVQTNGVITSVLTIIGLVRVANILNMDRMVELTKNQATRIRKSEPPAPAVQVPPDTIKRILTTDQPDDWEEVEFTEPTPESRAPEAAVPDDIVEEVQETVDEAREEVQESSSQGVSVEFTVTEKPD